MTSPASLTRSRILKAATTLFNEQGTVAVNTHHIAGEAGISPGNLYYHFKNKDEIIRQIFRGMDIYSENMWREKGPSNPKISFVAFNRFFFGNVLRYRFFFREFSHLLQSDPVLAREWRESYKNLFSIMRKAVKRWTDEGILRKFASPAETDAFIENCWMILNFSFVHLEASGHKPVAAEKAAIEQVIRFLYPYHTVQGQRALDLYLADAFGRH